MRVVRVALGIPEIIDADNEDVKWLVRHFPYMESVDLHGAKRVTEIWPLKNMWNLKTLDVSGTGVEHCPITLIHCPSLCRLNVKNTKVHTTTLARIIHATKVTLDTLRVGGPESNPNVDLELLRHLVARGYGAKIEQLSRRVVHKDASLFPLLRNVLISSPRGLMERLDPGDRSYAFGTLLFGRSGPVGPVGPLGRISDIAMIVDSAGGSFGERQMVVSSNRHGYSYVLRPEHWVCSWVAPDTPVGSAPAFFIKF